jgi:phosphatidylinositol alpha-1,6-mannosyltransferase
MSQISVNRSVLRPPSSVLHVGFLASDLSHRHGWAHYCLSLLQALKRAGAQVTVVTTRNSPDVDGITLHRLLPNTFPAERHILLKLTQNLTQIQSVLVDCNVIHAAIEPYAPVGAWVAGKRPFFATAHGSYIEILPRHRWPVGAIYRRAFQRAQIVCVSNYTAKVARATLSGIQPIVVNNGVDVERFAHLPSLDTLKRGPTVLCVGAVKGRKGTLELVQAMAEVRQQVSDVECVIIGSLESEPAYVERVKAAINDLNLSDCVHLLGHVPESTMLAWYGAADVFAMPSMNVGGKFEGFGLTHLEASAAGLPVIGTTDCGAEDAIVDGVTGLLVPQSAVTAALPGAIINLLTDPVRAKQMGAAGQERAQTQTWNRVAQRMIEVYENVRK